MGLSQLVYPGAQHNRFNHVLGSMHLTGRILDALRYKGVPCTKEQRQSAVLAAMLHDIGHGPFSHALEGTWIPGLNHEELGRRVIVGLNRKYEGLLEESLRIYDNKHPRSFFNQLLSGHLDADRLDYLKRDSFYCGVPEGSLNIERLIRVFDVVDDQLVVLEKGIHSIEEFLMARRFMYWQVYLHKTGLLAEILLKKATDRARTLLGEGEDIPSTQPLRYFLGIEVGQAPQLDEEEMFHHFIGLDDSDVWIALKQWAVHKDPLLRYFSQCIINRRLPKIKWISEEKYKEGLDSKDFGQMESSAFIRSQGFSEAELQHFFFQNEVRNSPYNSRIPELKVLMSDGGLMDFSNVSELFGGKALGQENRRYYRVVPRKAKQQVQVGP